MSTHLTAVLDAEVSRQTISTITARHRRTRRMRARTEDWPSDGLAHDGAGLDRAGGGLGVVGVVLAAGPAPGLAAGSSHCP